MNSSQDMVRRRVIQALAAVLAVPSVALAQKAGGPPTEITWDDLIDREWAKGIQAEMMALGRAGNLQDGTEAANTAMAKLREKWDAAPTTPTHLGKLVRLPGFVVPLDASRDPRRSFLLVPYFGACIHTPPPPANQIVLIEPGSKTRVERLMNSMEAIWVEGVLEASRKKTAQGVTGYRLEATRIEEYKPKKRG